MRQQCRGCVCSNVFQAGPGAGRVTVPDNERVGGPGHAAWSASYARSTSGGPAGHPPVHVFLKNTSTWYCCLDLCLSFERVMYQVQVLLARQGVRAVCTAVLRRLGD